MTAVSRTPQSFPGSRAASERSMVLISEVVAWPTEQMPQMREVMPKVLSMIPRHDEFLIPLERVQCETLFLWTADNPVHDVASARRACAQVARGRFYLMKSDSAHWPQFEAAEEFNAVARKFFATGRI